MRKALFTVVTSAILLTGLLSPPAMGWITIGSGPWIGTDSYGNSFNEEFQDWNHSDCRALDGAGVYVGGRYNFNDGYDDSRDLIAFYSRDEGDENGNYYFRVDLYDLREGAEVGNLDIYVAIDCAWSGQTWMPDWTDVEVSHPWEVCIKLYDTGAYDVINSSWASIGGFLGAYFNRELDSVEFGITKQTLYNHGWDGTSVMYFTVMTVKDGSNGGAGEIREWYPDGPTAPSDATDCFYDDDRGYSDGVIDGAIPSNASVGQAKYASIAHGNQSINQADELRVHFYDPPTTYKTGFVRTLETHEIFNVPINIHMSGSLMVAAKWAVAPPGDDSRTDGPTFLQRVADFVNNDQNDGRPGSLIGGVFAEHIMPYFEGDVNAKSIELFNELMLSAFGLTPDDVKIMHTPERVIRSQSTSLSPLDGHTFEDIENSSYIATYLDEVTHFHWWFDAAETRWSGHAGSHDDPSHHRIHKINGVYSFLINDREDQGKFGFEDNGMNLDVRYTLVDKAQGDPAQLTLVFDDWEALAGKSFDPVQGVSTENDNQKLYQQTIRWAANHQWIEIVNLKDILDRAINPGNPQYDSDWVIDHGYSYSLSLQTYEWLKHASEDSYHYWYYNDNAGYTGNEQDFYELVPVLVGPQGDYHRRHPGSEPWDDASANAQDQADGAVFLPSGKRHGDLNSPGTLMHDAWAAIASAPAGALRKLAEYAYTNLIYETGWHEEDYGATQHYRNTTYGNPWPVPDPTWDGVNTWALRLQNHVRGAGVLAAAAQWADNVKNGLLGPQTTVAAFDLDQDGQDEYVMYNNRVYVCFEARGGRLIHGFAFDNASDDALQVLGAPVVNPSSPGEEELAGSDANRCSTFKDMNFTYVDAVCSVSMGADYIEFTSFDGVITKRITLPAGGGTLQADYTNYTGGTHYVRVGASPNVEDLILHGRDHLGVAGSATQYRVSNSAGGFVRVFFGTASYNPTPADAGYENRNLALTEQIEVSGGSSFTFDVQINSGMFDADADGDVDLSDLAAFEDCLGGPNAAVPGPCGSDVDLMDWNGDGDVDLSDFARFQMSYTGNLTP
ncbi:MAG: hypothetical protein KAV82_11850 [Phycisphaerae bacterium]|nr:hypothetical protein [Phycisphaerae bacterium]